MDDFDIYDDLQLLQEQGKQKAEEDSQWKEKYHVALGTIEKLQTEKKELNKKIKLLETNFSSLLDTARTEIKRKDNQINELRREKDDLCFRRGVRPGGKHSHHDIVPPSSRNDNVDQGVSAGYTKSGLKNAEESKGHGPEYSGQRRNPFQGESSGRLGNSGDKNYKGRNSTKHQHLSHNGDQDSVALLNTHNILKHENIKESKTQRTGDLRKNTKELGVENIASVRGKTQHVCTKEVESAEKIMEEDILKDLKEFKKRKQCDVKKDTEPEEAPLVNSNEKSNVLFDALFDDLAMNNENSKETNSDLEAERPEIISEVQTNEPRDEEHSIAGMKPITPKILNIEKQLDDLFATTHDEHKEFGTDNVNKIKINKKGAHKSSQIISAVDTLNIASNWNVPVVEDINITKTKTALKNELESSKKSTPFKFAELDSSFYSSEEERDNDNGKGNVKEVNEKTENKTENRSKRNKNHSKGNKNESTSTGHANEESKYKNLQEDKLISRKHTSEHTEIKAGQKDYHRHSNRPKHCESLSHSKLHKHEQVNREGRSSRGSLTNLGSGNIENKNKLKSPLKNEHDRQPRKMNEYASLEKKQEGVCVASKKMKPPSIDDTVIINQSVDSKEKASSNIEKTSDDKEGFNKVKDDTFRESVIKQDDLIANKTDEFSKNEIIDNCVIEGQKPLLNASKTTEKYQNEINNTAEATATTIKHHEDQKDNASTTQSVVCSKLPGDVVELQTQNRTTDPGMISTSPRDESKNVVKEKQQTRKEHLLRNNDNNTTCNNTQAEGEIYDVNSKNNLTSSSQDANKSINISEPIGQITHGSDVPCEDEKMLKLDTNQSEVSEIVPETNSDDNIKQNDLKLNKANGSNTDSTSTEQLETNDENNVHNKVQNKSDADTPSKIPIPESDIDDNEMPSLLVEEEPEDVSSSEKSSLLKPNSENVDMSLPKITTENRIHHKKRMLQNSRSAEQCKENSSVQSEVVKVSILSSNHDSISPQSIPSHGTTTDKYEFSKKGLDSSNSVAIAVASSGQSTAISTEKCNVKERYKKKILQKYENSNKMEKNQCDSSNIYFPGTNASSASTQCYNNNNNADPEKLIVKNSDIKETPNHNPISKKTDMEVSVCKEPIKVTDSNTLCKNNPLQNSDKFKGETATRTVQCEKRKRPSTTEPEAANNRKVLKSHKNEQKHKQDKEVGANNLKTNVQKNPNVSLAPNMNTSDLTGHESGNGSSHLNYSTENSAGVTPKNISKEQSNETSSRSLIKKEKPTNNCKENVKSFSTDNMSLNECPEIKEDRNVLYLKRRSKVMTDTSKEKKQKRKLSSDSFEKIEEEKAKKSKNMETKSPNKLKPLSSNSKKQIKATGNKNKKPSTSPEEPDRLICGLNSNLIHHNIFSNDGCPDDRNLPVICNDKDDVQYQEIDKRLSSMFQSPTYKFPIMENVIDPKDDTFPQGVNDIILDHTINETLNKSEKSQCDTSSSSRKISVGSNDYVIETVGAHVANVFVTRKKCKKRTKIAVVTV